MAWFKKAKVAPEESKPEVSKDDNQEAREAVTLYAEDNCFVRARKLFQIMNLYDRLGLANKMAEGISIYQKLDADKAREAA